MSGTVSFARKIVTIDFSQMVGTTPVTIYTGAQLPGRISLLRVWNVSSTGGTVWLSRTGVAGVNAPGSYPLSPGTWESFTVPQAIPINNLSAVATVAGTALTVEVG
jgi:hypothetical protein